MGGYDSQPTIPQWENRQVVYSSAGHGHRVSGPRPHQGSDPRESSGRPLWAPIEESGGHAKHFKGAQWRD